MVHVRSGEQVVRDIGIDVAGRGAPLHARLDAADLADELLGEGDLAVGVGLDLVGAALPVPLGAPGDAGVRDRVDGGDLATAGVGGAGTPEVVVDRVGGAGAGVGGVLGAEGRDGRGGDRGGAHEGEKVKHLVGAGVVCCLGWSDGSLLDRGYLGSQWAKLPIIYHWYCAIVRRRSNWRRRNPHAHRSLWRRRARLQSIPYPMS